MKTIVITGANSGIGKVSATSLAGDGHQIILACRNEKKAKAAEVDILTLHPDAKIEVMLVDVGEPESVNLFAELFFEKYDTLDILINNAGVWNADRHENSKNYEAMFAINHLGYVYMTYKLMPALLNADQARIVNVSSNAHRWAKDRFDDLQWTSRKWSSKGAYGSSKMYNIWFTKALAKRLPSHITVNALHPGVIATNLADGLLGKLQRFASPLLKTPEQGAQTTLYLARSEAVEKVNGAYFSDKKEKKPNRLAVDEDCAEKMWSVSDQCLGIRFDDCLNSDELASSEES